MFKVGQSSNLGPFRSCIFTHQSPLIAILWDLQCFAACTCYQKQNPGCTRRPFLEGRRNVGWHS
jgi:hypothetical protein